MPTDDETDLSEPLAERDYRPVETDFPGDWATNGRWSIQLEAKRDVSGRTITVARVYDMPADALELPRAELLITAESHSHVKAARLALKAAADMEVLN